MYGGGWAADWRSESIRITDLHFADDRVRMAVTTEVLAEALESLSEEAEDAVLVPCSIQRRLPTLAA